ncbi:MAG: Asp-tRNA(Asn)/Glu-tRNA(Gln) amidotransferase subunit GatA [Candidatus Paceibacterota bacterium]|jgi:aspartyl-tRNA(Asn)/glutamyl-tRNA(Gln) amidotransferase subunit A
MEPDKLSIQQLHQELVDKKISAVELAKFFLDKIKKEDGDIRSFITITEDLALKQARMADEIIAKEKEELPLLGGIPCAIKDNILIDGIKCTSASKILENYTAPYDATVVKKLKDQGAVILGKTNMDEFAMGSSTENSAFFVTKNPRDTSRVPGGSSGGSAAATAAGFCKFALGSDTGGSIRQPASFCGVVGLKPTYGAVSRYGAMAFASSLDQIGPFARNSEDCRIVFDAIKGRDPLDSTSLDASESQEEFDLKNLKIGVPKEYFVAGMDKDVEKTIKDAIEKYEEMGAKIVEVSLPHTEYALPCYYIIATAEASANLARYDGIKYGSSEVNNPEVKDLLEVYIKSREKYFGSEVKRRIMLGTYVLSSGYYDAYYKRAQKVRTLIKNDFEKALSQADILLTPVSPTLPFKIGEKMDDPLSMYLSDIYTISINLAGVGALSLPAGWVDLPSGRLPVGMQLIAKPFEEKKMFQAAAAFEKIN